MNRYINLLIILSFITTNIAAMEIESPAIVISKAQEQENRESLINDLKTVLKNKSHIHKPSLTPHNTPESRNSPSLSPAHKRKSEPFV